MISFTDISNNPSNWYVVTDQVMGGKSELEVDVDNGVFSLRGYVTTINNGGFVRMAHRPKNVDKEIKGIIIENVGSYTATIHIRENKEDIAM